MKARAVALRPAVGALVAAEAVALAAFVALPPHRAGWWPATAISVAALVVLIVTVYRRNAPGWVAAWARHRRRRRHPVPVAAAVDVPHGAIVCGVRVDEYEAVTMIKASGRAYAPTLLRGSTRSLTTNVIPMDVLAGIAGSARVFAAGRHRHCQLRAAGAPRRRLRPAVQHAAGGPAGGRAARHLSDRAHRHHRVGAGPDLPDLDRCRGGRGHRKDHQRAAAERDSRDGSGRRRARHRIDRTRRGSGDTPGQTRAARRRARRVDEAQAAPAAAVPVGAHRGAAAPRTRWRSVHTREGYLSSYYFSPEDITTAGLNRMWALRTDEVVQTTSICKHRNTEPDGGGPVLVSAMVRTCDPQQAPQPPTLDLNPLPGEQYAATVRAAPTARPAITLPTRRLNGAEPLQIPIGATGILVGAALADDPDADPPIQRDDMVMLALTDPDRATRISMHTSEFYVRQLLIRAAAVGERIAIYSHQPTRWNSLTQPNIAVAERRRPPPFVPTITVNDRPTALSAAGLSATVISLGPLADDGPTPDLRFVQTSDSVVHVSTPTQSMQIVIVAFRQEQAWMGLT